MTVYLVRHASAGTRDDADPDDGDRMLDTTGHLQAERLAGWLRHEDVGLILSSPLRRCVQTVEPLAKLRDLAVVVDDRVAEGSEVTAAWTLLEEAARTTGDVVVCSHGDVIPEVVDALIRRGMTITGSAGGLRKGAMFVLHREDGRFARCDYVAPPQ